MLIAMKISDSSNQNRPPESTQKAQFSSSIALI